MDEKREKQGEAVERRKVRIYRKRKGANGMIETKKKRGKHTET